MSRITVLVFLAAFVLAPPLAFAIKIPTVPVGNAGNSADSGGYGSVAYGYRIGTTEVTNAQYVEFLNAKAISDPLALYNTSMGSGYGGITRSGSDGSYTYATISGRENMPVNFVSWYDAIRFANWLNNGQGNGDTETGAYTLLGSTSTPSNGNSIIRNTGATWFLTSENEWYKAAFYNPSSSSYFDYATASNTFPVLEAPPGGSNSANGGNHVHDLTIVGAYTAAHSPYGTFDQNGNVWEWNEVLYSGSIRGLRGGSYNSGTQEMKASYNLIFIDAPSDRDSIGFRVATLVVPEPSSIALAAVALVGLFVLWRRRRELRLQCSVQ